MLPQQQSFKLDQDNLGAGPYSQRRSPSARAAGRVHQHLAYPIEAVDQIAIYAASKPCPGNKLAQVRMPGNLQSDASRLGNPDLIGRMGQEHTSALAIDADFLQHRPEVTGMR